MTESTHEPLAIYSNFAARPSRRQYRYGMRGVYRGGIKMPERWAMEFCRELRRKSCYDECDGAQSCLFAFFLSPITPSVPTR
jgi:hypothetical protein